MLTDERGTAPDAWAAQTEYSDPGPHRAALAAVPPEPEAIHRAVTGLVAHYRGEADVLDDARLPEVDLRWCAAILDVGLARSPQLEGRASGARGAGCCRDHTLLALAVLREHGVPARSRVGFARYLTDGYHVDHVVVEHWDGARWVLWDPELPAAFGAAPFAGPTFDVRDMTTGLDGAFTTAAQAWTAHRRDGLDLDAYGVWPGLGIGGREFVRTYVVGELAHRRGDELLLWDLWGARLVAEDLPPEGALPDDEGAHAALVPSDEADTLADEVADLLLRADDGDVGAEAEAARRYAADPRLHPGRRIRTRSPIGRAGWTDLVARATAWD
ncbi:transglutaminase-like domain-containing protein [Cellulomonas sp. DKR-3]|uniref:Transglutaminase-like domain-containing protein n=1 Tax=Cellulomonas fulva TaxID=2835530 RepID=A0ABS5TUN9_9CELL|nr:transglutaminase-like domain-containing protein [Cellulomonas fulva]MBT0992861.1 transglutaminase-like domain-containing protein [Cellulomonas fulva]